MATVTTYTRPRPADATSAAPTDDLTPSALGALGTVVVTEDASADGGATVEVATDAYAWTGVHGFALDPRVGRPFRAAPWVPAYPTDLLALVTEEPLSAYITAPAVTSYANLLAALATKLGAWGWSSSAEVD